MMELLLTYKYLIVVPLAIIEEPIISVVCGFLTTLGVFNLPLVFAVLVLGDIVGDAIQYSMGYCGKRFCGKRVLNYFKMNDENLEKAKIYFSNNHTKAILASKLMYGVGFFGLVAAGMLHVPYRRYFKTCAIISLIQSTVMVTAGIFFGQAYIVIGKYFDYYAAISSVVALFIVFFILFKRYKKKVAEKIIIKK